MISQEKLIALTVLITAYTFLRNMKIRENFVWSLEPGSALAINDSLGIVGQTVQLKVMRAFAIGNNNNNNNSSSQGEITSAAANRIEIALSWTPSRKLVSLRNSF